MNIQEENPIATPKKTKSADEVVSKKVKPKATTKVEAKAPSKALSKAPAKEPLKAPSKAPSKAPLKAPSKSTAAKSKTKVLAKDPPAKPPVQPPVVEAPEPEVAPAKVSRKGSQASELSIKIAQLMSDTKCSAVRVLDCGDVSPVCDFLIIANGTSPRQMRSVVDQIDDLAEENGYKPRSGGRASSETWIALDLYDIIIHIFTPDARIFYDLDNLWGDAVDVEWKK